LVQAADKLGVNIDRRGLRLKQISDCGGYQVPMRPFLRQAIIKQIECMLDPLRARIELGLYF